MRARDEQANKNQNGLKTSCCNTEHRNIQKILGRPSLHYFHLSVQQKLSKITRFLSQISDEKTKKLANYVKLPQRLLLLERIKASTINSDDLANSNLMAASHSF